MKVLRIIPSMDPVSGGPCQGLRNMIPSLTAAGIENEVVSLDDPQAGFLGKDPFTIHAVGPAKGPWQYSKQLLPWLQENLHRFDVVVVHALWLYHSYAFYKAIKSYRKNKSNKAIQAYVMPHGMLDPYFQKAEERKLKAIRNWIYWKLIENKVVNNADGVFFTCEEELLLARQTFQPYHPYKELNIGYGVAAPPPFTEGMKAAFYTKCPHIKEKKFLLFLSRIHEKKGVDHLLEAYEQLLKENWGTIHNKTERFPTLLIAGPGIDTDYGRRLQQMVETSEQLKANVCFPGMLSGADKWGAFYLCDAFILPSHQENFGIAVVEALACSKPVLTTNRVNIWREIVEKDAGFVADDTTEGIKNLLSSWSSESSAAKETKSSNSLTCYQSYFAVTPAVARFRKVIDNG